MRRKLLLAGTVAPVVSLLIFHLDMITRPGYDALYHGPSLLMLGGRGWLQIANFVVTGAVMLACGLADRRRLMAVYGLAMICTGVFVTDPQLGYPPGTPLDLLPGVNAPSTWHGTLHWISVFFLYGAAVAACLVSRSRLLIAFGVAMPVVLLLGTLVFQERGITSEVYAVLDGVCGRLIIPLGWLWASIANHRAARA
ncbi:DUF998 domain-containing protein [Nonomuraea sp. NPDC050556]|uniref:DUF998 domain-containing protein n=1 Tax=Nonomuraea sp. NPDC050556 TaxID=3364369 RepID=UPI0037B8ACE5